ncbi:hypothetical protein BKA70DRAFT_1319905 [Coprinopsis sp. MPI-PUGE-AT-0042]|nr:hypothetical protein BKA70DRAFT_1319905 [Coprinopsis sp. MPI-PUGE-AT-0042]
MAIALDNDVLDIIFCECQISSLGSLVQVSSTFYAIALPHLLHSVTFKKNLSQLASFFEFILRCGGEHGGCFSEGRHVKRLEITLDPMSNSHYTDTLPAATWAPMLTSALQLMPNLRELLVGYQIEDIVHHSPLFISTLLACHSLKRFSLGKIGVETSMALGKACLGISPALRLEAASFVGAGVGEKWRPQPLPITLALRDGLVPFLRHAHIQQHMASLRFVDIDLEPLALGVEQGVPVLFPFLVEVHLNGCDFSLNWLAAAAPGIRTLSIFSCSIYRTSIPIPRTAFPQLVHFAGHHEYLMILMRLNALALETLHSLCVSTGWGMDIDDDEEFEAGANPLAVVKAASNLRNLTFPQSLEPPSWWRTFVKVLPPLTFLNISLGLESSSADEAQSCCTEIPDALAALPLEYVSLSLGGLGKLLDRPEDFGIATQPTEEGVAISWATRIPTLQYIDILLGRDYWGKDPAHYLMIERKNNGVSVRRLDIHIGQTIRESWDEKYAI